VKRELAGLVNSKVVFLDPDTGIEPKNPGSTHVLLSEITDVWTWLKRKDWLVLYQHAFRQKGWQERQCGKFEKACNNTPAQIFQCPGLAHDVAFFAARRD